MPVAKLVLRRNKALYTYGETRFNENRPHHTKNEHVDRRDFPYKALFYMRRIFTIQRPIYSIL